MSLPAKASGAAPTGSLIFVVDDEPLIGELLDIALTNAGFRVRVFSDPVAAAEAFADAEPKPAVLATDYSMPPMDGVELIRQCRAIDPSVRTLLFSGNITFEMLSFEQTKPERFLGKPFLPGRFVEEIRALLNTPPR